MSLLSQRPGQGAGVWGLRLAGNLGGLCLLGTAGTQLVGGSPCHQEGGCCTPILCGRCRQQGAGVWGTQGTKTKKSTFLCLKGRFRETGSSATWWPPRPTPQEGTAVPAAGAWRPGQSPSPGRGPEGTSLGRLALTGSSTTAEVKAKRGNGREGPGGGGVRGPLKVLTGDGSVLLRVQGLPGHGGDPRPPARELLGHGGDPRAPARELLGHGRKAQGVRQCEWRTLSEIFVTKAQPFAKVYTHFI